MKTIYWLNGTFGVGKRSTARELVDMLPAARQFDPEDIGGLLRTYLPEHSGDFQDLAPWRHLTIATAAELLDYTGRPLVVPMTLLRRDYAEAIFTGLNGRGIRVHHILLHADEHILRRRISEHDMFPDDPQHTDKVRAWRLDHLPAYQHARAWLATAADLVVDTTELTPKHAARHILEHCSTSSQ